MILAFSNVIKPQIKSVLGWNFPCAEDEFKNDQAPTKEMSISNLKNRKLQNDGGFSEDSDVFDACFGCLGEEEALIEEGIFGRFLIYCSGRAVLATFLHSQMVTFTFIFNFS